ncbi:MAG: putative lipoprotein [Edaphobacter sp.]|nr:putative lipoprotein [Edaphobacter sp.]
MKKVVVASLLAVASVASVARMAVAQTQANPGASAQASGGIQMSPAEYAAYNAAIGQPTPQAKAPALEAYLTAYPQSAVKAATLEQLMLAYSSFDPVKTLDAADRLLQVDPNNLRALTFEAFFRKASADALTDPAAKQAALDKAAEYAQKGLAAPKPAGMSDADFATLQTAAKPVFYSTIATAALNKKDTATAITNFKQELASVPEEQTKAPGPLLQDTYFLAVAYLQSTPPDLVNCAYYAARVAAYAPDQLKPQFEPTAKYCYKKYHGADDGYDAVVTAAKASLNPPPGFSIKPAPSPSDIVAQVIASTPDLSTLAISDKEFILQNGKPEDAAKVWDTMKGKSVQFPDATVISVSDTALQVAVSEDAVQSKTADFTFQLKEPLKTPPAVGAKVTVSGTYASFTPNPIMITMSDGAIVEPKKPTPAHRAPARKR